MILPIWTVSPSFTSCSVITPAAGAGIASVLFLGTRGHRDFGLRLGLRVRDALGLVAHAAVVLEARQRLVFRALEAHQPRGEVVEVHLVAVEVDDAVASEDVRLAGDDDSPVAATELREAVLAIHGTTDEMVRLANQLLALARAEGIEVDLLEQVALPNLLTHHLR